MPKGDGTGPNGQGPMTGRGLGYCAGYPMPGFMNCRFGRGMGRGRGFAWRARFIQPATPVIQEPQLTEQDEKKLLEQEKEAIKQELEDIEKRLKELKAK